METLSLTIAENARHRYECLDDNERIADTLIDFQRSSTSHTRLIQDVNAVILYLTTSSIQAFLSEKDKVWQKK